MLENYLSSNSSSREWDIFFPTFNIEKGRKKIVDSTNLKIDKNQTKR